MLHLRLNKEIETKLNLISEIKGISKSQIIHDALQKYLENYDAFQSSVELGKDLFGVEGQDSHLSVESKRIIKEKIESKFRNTDK